jgi:predicted lipoprotein with Yx(FWY)xxD motif
MRRSGANNTQVRRLAVCGLAILALALAGCMPPPLPAAPAATATEAPMEEPTAAEPTVEMTATVEMEPTVEMTATVAMTDTVTGPATVMVSDNAELGDILTDDNGMTLYLFTNDTPGTSNCYDQCAVNWPPLLTSGDPIAGEGADAGLIGTTERTDGTVQVTYNGWPLYYWINDTGPGDTTGQGVGEVWYVLSPQGEMIE